MELLREHDNTPGRVYQECLILGGRESSLNEMMNFNQMDFKEAHSSSTRMKFKGKLQEGNGVNKNKRKYPKNILEVNVKRLSHDLEAKGLIGELDHPSDSILHLEKGSHLFTKLWWEGNNLMGEGVVLSTPAGQILEAYLRDGVRIGMSSRGVGSGKVDDDGILVIGENFRLITFDAVADPSTYGAFQEKLTGKQNESVSHASDKIESQRLHKSANKELLLMCMAGMFQKELRG